MEAVINQMATPFDIVQNLTVNVNVKKNMYPCNKILVKHDSTTVAGQNVCLLLGISTSITSPFPLHFISTNKFLLLLVSVCRTNKGNISKELQKRLKVMCRITIMLYMSKMNKIEFISDL